MIRFTRFWGSAVGFLDRSRRMWWVDFILLAGLLGLVFGLFGVAHEWTVPHRDKVDINLSPLALPYYTFLTLVRGLIGYLLSIIFTLLYGYWAAKDHVAERVLVPMLDILQSIPILGFLPGLVTALLALFPGNNVGLEMAVILAIFTSQAWNMTFSYYHSLRSVPENLHECATLYNFTWWERLKWLEIPISMIGLVWNSMMSMAGGWFFITVAESFQLGDQDYRLPGLGAYISVANDENNKLAQFYGIAAMILMIVALDQLLWRPVVVWSEKFRIDDGGHPEKTESWVLNFLRRSKILEFMETKFFKPRDRVRTPRPKVVIETEAPKPSSAGKIISTLLFVGLIGVLAYGGVLLVVLLKANSLHDWLRLVGMSMLTLGRVLSAVTLATLIALPIGLKIGLSPKLSSTIQPVIQVMASFPAPMLFPLALWVMAQVGIDLMWGSILLMLLGTQWYLLFNVAAGAMAIPADIREAADGYGVKGFLRFWTIYLPGVFPYLVTGWVTAAGGAWNASIVSEYVTVAGKAQHTRGIGAEIAIASASKNNSYLAAAVVVMSVVVVLFNRLVWKRMYDLAETKYSLSR